MLRNKSRPVYRQEGDTWLVEIRIDQLEQLFDNLDPAPFWRRDLDEEAAAYILESVKELPAGAPVRILVYLPTEHLAEAQALVSTSLESYFLYRARVHRQRLRKELQRGRISLAVGLSFLTVCFLLSQALSDVNSFGSHILREGLLIMGWVAMWRPIETFLYEWWPHLNQARHHERVAQLPVEVRNGMQPDQR